MDRTLVFIKPDGVKRRLIGELISRFERKGLKIVGLKFVQLTEEQLNEHYTHLALQLFFPEIKDYMKSGPVVMLCLEGLDAVKIVRDMCGVTNARKAVPGTIRGDLALSIQFNLIHTSDSKESARREIKRFFRPEELFLYNCADEPLLYSTYEVPGRASAVDG